MTPPSESLVSLDLDEPIWNRLLLPAPLVVIGTKEWNGYNLAPKHMVTPVSFGNYFGFACTPRHATYHSARHTGTFTVSFPTPEQVDLVAQTAALRCDLAGHKPSLAHLPVRQAQIVDGVLLEGAWLGLECELEHVVDHLGPNSFLIGRIVAAQARADLLLEEGAAPEMLIQRNPLLMYVHPDRYAVIEETHPFPMPERFER